MIINFLYCIDYPDKNHLTEKTDKISGWLLCSRKIRNIKFANKLKNKELSIEYGRHRPDVAAVFKDFSENEHCGILIRAQKNSINRSEIMKLEVEVEISETCTKKIKINIILSTNTIQDVDVESNRVLTEWKLKINEKKYFKTLKQHPWITIRMDITNKCNLRCIMCHCREKEIYSKPAQNITAGELKQQLMDIAPCVRHLMLSCGYEPLMSKHFSEIVKMIHEDFPHMEIGVCTNGMLLSSKIRKDIIENQVTTILFSLDGVQKSTVERIRVGANFERIVGNIMALRDLKRIFNRTFPLMYMDFVLMNSNIHEAPAFVGFCKELGMELIDFRHMVGNTYFSEHEEMLSNHKEKFNFYRNLILQESVKYNIPIRIPDAYVVQGEYEPETLPDIDILQRNEIKPDEQTIEVSNVKEVYYTHGEDSDFKFLNSVSCNRPFNEIMIREQNKIRPCSYYSEEVGVLDEKNTLGTIFRNEKFTKARRKKYFSIFDFNCMHCPIKSNLLPTDIIK